MTSDPTDHLTLYEQTVSSIDEVCSQLARTDWDLPTDCPGWSVKDTLAHLGSYEAIASGRAAPASDLDVSHLAHVDTADAFAPANEREIEKRRSLPAPAILEEFRDAVGARLKHLAGLDEAGWDADRSTFPWGEAPTKDSMAIRILDLFFHEQDIRRAVDRPGHLDGAVAAFVFERLATFALPRVLAKNAGAPDGTQVTWDVEPPGRPVGAEVREGRGESIAPPPDPTVRFASDLETFLCLFGGRREPGRCLAEGRLSIEGDTELAGRILDAIVVVP